MAQYLDDHEFGRIFIKPHARARRAVFRYKDNQWYMTIPYGWSVGEVYDSINRVREDLRKFRDRQETKAPRKTIQPDTVINTPSFQLHIRLTEEEIFRAFVSNKGGAVSAVISVNKNTDFNDPDIQLRLEDLITKSAQFAAKQLLPRRLMQMAQTFGLPIPRVSIHNTTTRWGSRSSKGSINLSLFCIFLPVHLQDYIMKHELAHITHMNHSDQFWALCDTYCDGKAMQLEQEMRTYQPTVKHYLSTSSDK